MSVQVSIKSFFLMEKHTMILKSKSQKQKTVFHSWTYKFSIFPLNQWMCDRIWYADSKFHWEKQVWANNIFSKREKKNWKYMPYSFVSTKEKCSNCQSTKLEQAQINRWIIIARVRTQICIPKIKWASQKGSAFRLRGSARNDYTLTWPHFKDKMKGSWSKLEIFETGDQKSLSLSG